MANDDTWQAAFAKADLLPQLKREMETAEEAVQRLEARRKAFFDSFPAKFDRFKHNKCAAPLGDKLTDQQIAAFEGDKIRLPKDYRNFLLHCGNGGFCSDQESHPLKPLPLDSNAAWETASKPFLWTRAVGILEEDTEQGDRSVVPPREALLADLKEHVADELWDNGDRMQGTVTLQTGFYLVLNGPCRGQVWEASSDHISEVYRPYNPALNPAFQKEYTVEQHGAHTAEYMNELKRAALEVGPVCDFIGFVNLVLFKARNWH